MFGALTQETLFFSYNKPQLFALIAKARTLTSQTARATLYAQAADMIAQDVRDIYIAYARLIQLNNNQCAINYVEELNRLSTPIAGRIRKHGLVPR
jgi:hypothetical protein